MAAFAVAGFDVASGGLAGAPLAAVAAGAGVGAAGALVGRKLSHDTLSFLDAELARGGVLLWVRTPDESAEARAIHVLRRHASDVHGQSVPVSAPGR